MGSCYFGTLTDIPLGFRLSESPIDTIPPGGFGGAEPPQRVDPLPSWLGRRRRRRSKKVASIWLKIAKQVAIGYAQIAMRRFRACQNSYGFRAIWSQIFFRTKIY